VRDIENPFKDFLATAVLNHRPLTVQLYLEMSWKYPEAENFFRMTTVQPYSSDWPMHIIPAAVWYSGRGV